MSSLPPDYSPLDRATVIEQLELLEIMLIAGETRPALDHLIELLFYLNQDQALYIRECAFHEGIPSH